MMRVLGSTIYKFRLRNPIFKDIQKIAKNVRGETDENFGLNNMGGK